MFDTLYVDCEYLDYIEKESSRTVLSLTNRIKPYDNEKQNDILISIDAQSFTQQDYTYITQLAAILKDSGATGEFKLGNLQISIIQLK